MRIHISGAPTERPRLRAIRALDNRDTSEATTNPHVVTGSPKAGGKFSDYSHLGIYFAGSDIYEQYNVARIKFAEKSYVDKDWFAATGTIARSLDHRRLILIEAIASVAD